MTAVGPCKTPDVTVADVVQRQIAGLPGKADQLTLPPAVVGEVSLAVANACPAVGSQLHDVHVHALRVMLADIHGGLVDACAHSAQDDGLQCIRVPAGVGDRIQALGG